MTEPAITQNQNATPTSPTQESLQLSRRFTKAIEGLFLDGFRF
ncbi:hypothetical protein [Nostoc sp. LEGE 06077]|nr:hypothetical protein [Nostoc sp. LEGE 06077]